jgi:hypothetical protein
MDALIRTAWRAFWVGLGASAVLVSQSLLAPSPLPLPTPAEPAVAPAPTLAPAAARPKSADPILSRNPFDSNARPLAPRCATVASVTRCS